MSSIDKIMDGLYLGDIRAAQNLFQLKSKGITHILQALGGVAPAFPSQFSYKVLQVMDVPWENLGRYFMDSALFIKNAIDNGGTVFVHCWAGISRSTSCLCAYLMFQHGLTASQAIQHVRRCRSIINPNPGFRRQLQEFERKLQAMRKANKQQDSTSQIDQKKQNYIQEQNITSQQDKRRAQSNLNFGSLQGSGYQQLNQIYDQRQSNHYGSPIISQKDGKQKIISQNKNEKESLNQLYYDSQQKQQKQIHQNINNKTLAKTQDQVGFKIQDQLLPQQNLKISQGGILSKIQQASTTTRSLYDIKQDEPKQNIYQKQTFSQNNDKYSYGSPSQNNQKLLAYNQVLNKGKYASDESKKNSNQIVGQRMNPEQSPLKIGNSKSEHGIFTQQKQISEPLKNILSPAPTQAKRNDTLISELISRGNPQVLSKQQQAYILKQSNQQSGVNYNQAVAQALLRSTKSAKLQQDKIDIKAARKLTASNGQALIKNMDSQVVFDGLQVANKAQMAPKKIMPDNMIQYYQRAQRR